MSKKRGFNQQKCDDLKRDRKNLTNKLYRRNVTSKKTLTKSAAAKNQSDIRQIKNQIDRLNTRIWKCSKQYFDLTAKKRNTKQKIYRRKKKLSQAQKGTTQFKEIKSQISDLNTETTQLESKIFRGSDRYSNMKVNLQRLVRKQKYRQSKLKSGEIKDPITGKIRALDKSEKILIAKEIISIQSDIDQLKHLLDIPIIEYEVPDFKDMKFRMDEDDETEIYSRPIFLWENQWNTILDRNIYKTAIAQGTSFKIPEDRISLLNEINNLVAEFSPYGSAVNVTMTANNERKIATIDFELIENPKQ